MRLFSGKYDDEFVERYKVQPSSSYDVAERARRIRFVESDIIRCLYRPFDIRTTVFDRIHFGFTSRRAHKVMRHMLAGNNLGLLSATTRSTEIADGNGSTVLCLKGLPIQQVTLSP